jgi:Uma2 family endonuclease
MERPYTAEDLFARGTMGPDHELWDGVLVARDPSGLVSDAVAARVVRHLVEHVEPRGLGLVTASSAGFVVARDPDRVLAPDAAFVRRERLASSDLRRFFEGPPDLAVEVRSFTDRWPDVLEKAGIWIAHGARLVWAIEPTERIVEAFEPGVPSRGLGVGDVLEGGAVLPEFEVELGSLFPDFGA